MSFRASFLDAFNLNHVMICIQIMYICHADFYHIRCVYQPNDWLNRLFCCRCASRPQHEVRPAAVQPQGVLPRGAQALTLPQLCVTAGGWDLQRGPWRHVRLRESAGAASQPDLKALCRYFCLKRVEPVPLQVESYFFWRGKCETVDIERFMYTFFWCIASPSNPPSTTFFLAFRKTCVWN